MYKYSEYLQPTAFFPHREFGKSLGPVPKGISFVSRPLRSVILGSRRRHMTLFSTDLAV